MLQNCGKCVCYLMTKHYIKIIKVVKKEQQVIQNHDLEVFAINMIFYDSFMRAKCSNFDVGIVDVFNRNYGKKRISEIVQLSFFQ